MIDGFFKYLNENTGPNGSWYIHFNDHTSAYQTAEADINDYEAYPGYSHSYEFQSDDMRKKAIKTNTIYYLQWYRNNPGSFDAYAAPTLESLAAWILSEGHR